MAVYDLVGEWTRLRGYVQSLWREVAYDDLNSAVAGAVSNVAISMIKKAASAMFVDYPGHDSYETVMKTITRGNPDKAQGMFSVALYSISPDKARKEKVKETHVDVKEQFMIHAYNDLRDFILDFQKTHSGKPTKRMLAELGNWDPKLNLQNASDEGRIKWRRSYTINWLYDLVNVFSSIVVQRNTMKGEKHDLSKVDWSVTGPWNKHCRLFGLNEFAGWVTTLAFQKPGTVDISSKILPHHVFGLQCIVDSLTVSRGWSLSGLRGHILTPPPRDFRPRRDVDLFLDRENKEFGRGYLQPVDILKQLFEKDDFLHGDFDRHRDDYIMLEGFQFDFVNWLGESKYMFGLTTIPPSRFSNSNANGLWEYSPFLCGVGLLDALELAYSSTLFLWDRIPEAVMLIHLHNMLVQKGYIQQPVGLYASLLGFFPGAFFADGKIPTSDFGKALVARMSGRETSPRAWNQRRRQAAQAASTHGILDTKGNLFFNVAKPCPVLLREADWDPERIPDADIPVNTLLAALRLKQTKIVTDHKTGEKKLEETELVRRTKSKLGADDKTLLQTASSLPMLGGGVNKMQAVPDFLRDVVPEGYKARWASETGKHRPNGTRQEEVPHKDLLEFIKWDVYRDICGDSPIMSLNMVWVTVQFFMVFMKIEGALEEAVNDLWLRAYKMDKKWAKQKRVGLTYMALLGADGAGEFDPDDVEECLEIMAEQFQNPRAGFMNHIYWKDLEEMFKRMERMERIASSRQKHHPADDACTVM
ncbi:hypothetical protein QBC46DRAFT_377618 [Diplogelasinospora grovesii]|uniref:DUF6604 domain-containing protein n=1 Tax=Diplogelasinospora grovesii TaxID=303347 RepID=A0AAN6NDB0_9PEZI|nr:hypothetical protein QBC46DRAFT_377618 [Diplogelasinospora grovesii]